MQSCEAVPYICPEDRTPLRLEDAEINNGRIQAGYLTSTGGKRYQITDGIVDFIDPSSLSGGDADSVQEYDRTAEVYDRFLPITFATVSQDELAVRRAMVNRLNVSPGATVLEVGCGTGRDTVLIAELLGPTGTLYAQDLSLAILEKCREKFAGSPLRLAFARANASAVPLPDACCDAVFHFGGLNTFTHLDRALEEMCRVTREGGRVVVGDEGIAPWMRSSLLGRVLMHNNPLYCHEPPLARIPSMARNLGVEWVFGGIFYLIAFDVSRQALEINLDLPIPGKRGGTHRTRYFGKLEGVTLETKSLALAASEAAGKSMHDWLDAVVRAAAEADLRSTGAKRVA
jgi:SAM-dependent methyltransferase